MRRCGLLRCTRNDGAIVIRNQSARVMSAAFSPIIGALELPPISIGLIAALTLRGLRRLAFSASNRLRPIGSSTPVLADPTGQRGGLRPPTTFCGPYSRALGAKTPLLRRLWQEQFPEVVLPLKPQLLLS